MNDFGNINLTGVGEMGKLKQIDNIKQVLNRTVYSSYVNGDYNKLVIDLDSTANLLEKEFKKKGITLNIEYVYIAPNITFTFNITTEELFSSTKFGVPLP